MQHPSRSRLLILLFLLSIPYVACAESTKIPGSGRSDIELEIHRPPNFDAGQEVSVIVGPGNYYWSDQSPQPGWLLVTGEAFFGDQRLQNSKLALAWLRQHFKIRNGGFHITGWSANSAGVFEIAMAYPEEFLSVTGIGGMPGQHSEDDLKQLQDIRVQFIVGENDTYWRQGSERWHKKMQDLGIASTMEIIPDGEHVMPEIANGPLFERFDRLLAEIENETE